MLKKIISGGQTGADQGALDAARDCGFPYGGALPAGRKTERGMLPQVYVMEVLESDRYEDRTRRNVVDGDGTLILSHGPLSGGSGLTMNIARQVGKPCLHIDFDTCTADQAVIEVSAWIDAARISILNVAGPRASSDAEIYACARTLIADLIRSTSR
ncbi:MAG: putative molybdenum carrier protein [Desulfofustis sp.]|jgi:hypothetical protein|nr:putative molybdenum carrier protein [Desulfofustis sp.]